MPQPYQAAGSGAHMRVSPAQPADTAKLPRLTAILRPQRSTTTPMGLLLMATHTNGA